MYIYQADTYCDDCGDVIKTKLRETFDQHKKRNPLNNCRCDICTAVRTGDENLYDSDYYPKGPYAEWEERSDAPIHCAACELFLENGLTEEGYRWLREKIKEYKTTGQGRKEIIELWSDFYNVSLDEEEEDETTNS